MKQKEPPKNKAFQGVIVGTPTFGMISYGWTISQLTMSVPIFTNMGYYFVSGKPVDVARNEIAYYSMLGNAGFVLFRDDDTIAPRDALIKLVKRFRSVDRIHPENSNCIVGGVVYSKTQPPTPMIFREGCTGGIEDWEIGELIECDVIGMGCTMIPVGVFRKLLPHVKHYRCGSTPDMCQISWHEDVPKQKDDQCPSCRQPLLPGLFKTVRDTSDLDNNPSYMTEDSYFCLLAKQQDIKTYCDTGVQTRHEEWNPNPREVTHYYYHPGAGAVWEKNGVMFAYPSEEQIKNGNKKPSLKQNGAVRFNLGSGTVPKKDYINIDLHNNPDFTCDIRNLFQATQKYGQADEIRASHVLEHLSRDEILGVVRSWIRSLKPGGVLNIEVPDGIWAMKNFIEHSENGDATKEFPEAIVYGEQTNPLDFHKTCFTEKKFQKIMRACVTQVDSYKIRTIFPKNYNQRCISVRIKKKLEKANA